MGDLLEKEKHKGNTLPFFEHSKAVWGTRSGWLSYDMWPKKVDPGSMSVGESMNLPILYPHCVRACVRVYACVYTHTYTYTLYVSRIF